MEVMQYGITVGVSTIKLYFWCCGEERQEQEEN